MPRYIKVVDAQPPIRQNYFAIVFFRGERVRDKLSLLRWSWLCAIEVLFGKELLESFVITASNSGSPEDLDEKREYGEPNHLNLHIPSGIFTNLFRQQLLQVLYYKFHLQYLLILPLSTPFEDQQRGTIELTRVRFRLRKSLLYLIIPFRRVYVFSAIAVNLAADLLAYLLTTNLWVAFTVGASLEFIRRILKL